jgi:hypothetical protein
VSRSALQALLNIIQQTASAAATPTPTTSTSGEALISTLPSRLSALRALQLLREVLLYLIPCRGGGDVAPVYPQYTHDCTTPLSPTDLDIDDNEWLVGKRRSLRTVRRPISSHLITSHLIHLKFECKERDFKKMEHMHITIRY